MDIPAHTPGEWEAVEFPTGWVVRSVYQDAEGRRCTAYPAVVNCGGQPNEANAHLIAAARDLLKAARRALAVLKATNGESVRPGNALGALHAAIAKAEGRS